ncbi:MAG: Cupin 2 conserved barrel domain protein [Myxococcales bacterium]|nr:Cupin 2 conserved barrel domain protein [Myxococcales bacterium]
MRRSAHRTLWGGVAATVAAGWVGAAASQARANATLETEEQRISRVMQSALVAHGGEVNRCFEKALADTLDVSGKIELSVDVGAAGRVLKTAPALDEVKSPVLLACLQETALTWSLAGIDPGSTVIVPLAFEGQAAQFTVKVADAPDHGPGVQPPKPAAPGAKPAPVAKTPPSSKSAPPFSVKLLVDESTVRARKASLSLLTISPASRIAMHQHPVAEILYVRRGHARILSRTGTPPVKLDEGQAIFLPPNTPHVIENMGRQSPIELLEVFSPMGPERVYRDPKDAVGRANFEVIRGDANPAGAQGGTAGMPAPLELPVVTLAKLEPVTLPGGKARVRMAFEPAGLGHPSCSFGLLEAEPGAETPRHDHAGSEEILFVLSGGGELTIGSEKMPFGPDEAIYIPEGQPHSVKFTGPDKTLMLQLYAPAGPEQRFKVAAPTPPMTNTTKPPGKPTAPAPKGSTP